MTKMIIQEKRISERFLLSVIRESYGKPCKLTRKRGQIYLFFPGKDLTHENVLKIAKRLKMDIVSESFVRAVLSY